MGTSVKPFFANSGLLDSLVTRPLSHIQSNWELRWDAKSDCYVPEDDSCAAALNKLVDDLDATTVPRRYHDNEDALANYAKNSLGWPIRKENNRWVGADYESILEQGGFSDVDEQELLAAAAGRIEAAIQRGQTSFDDMEESHRHMLAAVLSIILYHRVV